MCLMNGNVDEWREGGSTEQLGEVDLGVRRGLFGLVERSRALEVLIMTFNGL